MHIHTALSLRAAQKRLTRDRTRETSHEMLTTALTEAGISASMHARVRDMDVMHMRQAYVDGDVSVKQVRETSMLYVHAYTGDHVCPMCAHMHMHMHMPCHMHITCTSHASQASAMYVHVATILHTHLYMHTPHTQVVTIMCARSLALGMTLNSNAEECFREALVEAEMCDVSWRHA